jgi:hypothetical protein
MIKFPIFIIRAILGGVFAVVICRMFRPDAQPVFIVSLGVILVGITYLMEYFRKKKSDPQRKI